MRFLHTASAVSARFDDPNLITDAGLVPVLRPAQRCGLPELTDKAIRIVGADNSGGARPAAKVVSLVAAMAAGADSIDDADRLRHGGMDIAFSQTRAPRPQWKSRVDRRATHALTPSRPGHHPENGNKIANESSRWIRAESAQSI